MFTVSFDWGPATDLAEGVMLCEATRKEVREETREPGRDAAKDGTREPGRDAIKDGTWATTCDGINDGPLETALGDT